MAIQTTDLTDRNTDSKRRVSQSNEDDGTSTEAAWTIAEALGVRVDTCQRVVDSYGAEHSLAALADVQKQITAGKQLRSPIAVMIANLKSGAVQVEVASHDPSVDWVHERHHNQQADPTIDTAAKRLARDTDGKRATVVCPCGQEFPAAVQ